MSSIKIISLLTCERLNLDLLARDIESSLHVATGVLEKSIDPSFAYDHNRAQYLSTAILSRLLTVEAPAGCKILGITDVDLFIPILTYVFGEAQLGGRVGIVSTCRLNAQDLPGIDGHALMYDRLLKETKHELGHAFGLVHCRNINCVLYPSTRPDGIDNKGNNFCMPCRTLLNSYIKKLD